MGNQNSARDEHALRRRLADLEGRLAALETAPRSTHTSVSGGRTHIRRRGALRVSGETDADVLLHVGRDDGTDGASAHRVQLGRPIDGSPFIDLRSTSGADGQWALRDREGRAVIAEGPTGVGLARPIMPVATSWISSHPSLWPSTTSTSWTTVMYAWSRFQHTVTSFWFLASAISTSGQIRFRVAGTVIGTRSIPQTPPAPESRQERFTVDGADYIDEPGPVLVELQARCNSSNGGVHATALYNEGAGAVPEVEPAT
ncbi:hypothetical protein [Nocardiopsis alba]|uniref:hypothetical protein n=1 Tax=Nocardiopsis alba TaxID=53437 RepID=UPI0035E04931